MTDDPDLSWVSETVVSVRDNIDVLLAPNAWPIWLLVIVVITGSRMLLPTIEGRLHRPRVWLSPNRPKQEDIWFGLNLLSKPIALLAIVQVVDSLLLGGAALALAVSFFFHDLPSIWKLPSREISPPNEAED